MAAMKRRSGGKLPLWKRVSVRLVSMDGTPEKVAAGVAIGVFLGIAPTFGLGAILAAALAALFRANLAAAVLGSVIGVPFVAPFIWLASSWLGGLLLGMKWEILYAQVKAGEIWSAGERFVWAFALGNVILTVIGTALAYFVVRAVVRKARRSPASKRRPDR